jgi:hypothetical protein
MISSAMVGKYTHQTARFNTENSAHTNSFRKTNESNVLIYFPKENDVAEISQEAKNKFINPPELDNEKVTESKDKMSEWKDKLDQMRREMNWLRDEIRRAGEIAEGMGEAMREMIKCLRIAMRIMSGHNVPEADHRYLMDKDTALYSKAIMMRKEIIDPEDLERLSEDEEANADSTEIGEIPESSAESSIESSGDVVNTIDTEA